MTTDLDIERIFREEHGRVVASLIRRFGDIDIAEDAAAEALLAAVERWPADGVPPNPGGWLTTTAARKAIDKIRRESHRDAKYQQAAMIIDDTPHEPTGPVEDDRLRLIFTCCHPALAPEARVALTLRLLGGLTVPEIAVGVPGLRDHDGPADHPGEEEDRRRATSPTGCRRPRTCPPGCRACWPCSTSSSTRATWPPPGPLPCGST